MCKGLAHQRISPKCIYTNHKCRLRQFPLHLDTTIVPEKDFVRRPSRNKVSNPNLWYTNINKKTEVLRGK
jgi:hypothetical protein